MIEQHKKYAEMFLVEVLSNKRIDLIDEIFHPDYGSEMSSTKISELMWEENIREKSGLDALKERTNQLYSVTNMKYEPSTTIAEKNTVIIQYDVTLTHIGPYLGFPPTNKAIKMKGFHQFGFKEGKIFHIRFVLDFIKFLQEVGVAVFQENNETKVEEYIQNLRRMKIIPEAYGPS